MMICQKYHNSCPCSYSPREAPTTQTLVLTAFANIRNRRRLMKAGTPFSCHPLFVILHAKPLLSYCLPACPVKNTCYVSIHVIDRKNLGMQTALITYLYTSM